MITNRTELKEWLAYERCQYGCPTGIKGIIRYLAGEEKSVIWHFQKRMRITEYYSNTQRKWLLYLSIYRFNKIRNRYSLLFHLNTCGKGLKIMHLGPILMNKNVRIGNDCVLHMNTSFVAKGITNAAPTIGNGVVVGVGAVVMGGIYIANNVAIGANAVVNKDILEENIAVAGVPAKKVSNSGRLTWNNKQADINKGRCHI